jgi:histone acetyltransferase (RNA polymerase elongator complex component)
MDEEVLSNSGRGHKVEDIIKASELIKKSGLNLGLQMMIGLPYDTLEKTKKTAIQIINLHADCTRIYPTLVIKDTILERLYYKHTYKPLSLDEAVEWTKEIYNIFLDSNTKVIRIGLHPSEGLTSGDSLIAGPFHASFKELVLSKIWKDIFSQYKFENESKRITIYVAEEQLNYAIGYHSVNKNELKKKYMHIFFKTDHSLKGNNFYVNYN